LVKIGQHIRALDTKNCVVDSGTEGCLSTATVVDARSPQCYIKHILPVMLMLVHAGITPFVICLLSIIFCCLPIVVLPYSNILSVPGNCISSGHLDMRFIRTISTVYRTTRRHIVKDCHVLHYDNKMKSERAVEWAAERLCKSDRTGVLDVIVVWKVLLLLYYYDQQHHNYYYYY